ncbi:MAG: glyoxalase [Saprospiraceae bacterium]|nr:glyoxalase [Saprospiraceae bacterium]
MRNEQALLQLRPDLNLPTNTSGPEEIFQNQTLRPILKMQHALLVQLLASHIRKHKSAFFQLPETARLDWISNVVRADLRFRNLLVGTVLGHFTLEELHSFEAHEAECLRRLIQLIIQRLQSVEVEMLKQAH